ncbi:MAG: YfiR family protein, partial [Comamonadaceae bacterium]
ILGELKSKAVLTVSDAPEFLSEGGVIRFQVEDRVRMSINLDQARAVSLAVPTRMLEVSHEVLENGVIRKMR